MTPDQELELLRLRARAKKSRYPLLSQVNRGIAESVGGVVDFLNPLDSITGSATTGIISAMRGAGVEVAEGAPVGVAQGAARGLGAAAGAAIPAAGAFRAVGAFGGAVGAAAREGFKALTSTLGLGIEAGSGAAAGAAETSARDAGAGETGQMLAGLAAGVAAPAAVLSAPRAGRAVALAAPVTGRAIRGAQAALAPYTREGALNVARGRVQGLAGGPERAAELAKRIDPESQLTPAQQTEDANLLGLERAAGEADPTLGDRMRARFDANRERLIGEAQGMGGDATIADTRAAVAQRRAAFRTELRRSIDAARARAGERLQALEPKRAETENSLIVSEEIRKSFREAQDYERQLWEAVPNNAAMDTATSRGAVARIVARTPRAQEDDIPRKALRFLGAEGEFGPAETVSELHGLYSALREEARNAMAGTNQNRNRARIANEIADAILEDLGTMDPASEVGRLVNIAREFSREMHQNFDQGSVGKLLRRTVNTDEQIAPELALDRTVARGGAAGDTAFADIRRAVGAQNDVELTLQDAVGDFLKRQFGNAAFTSDGQFSRRGALTFLRNNQELLTRFPELRTSFAEAARDKVRAEALAERATSRLQSAESPRQSMGARFLDSPEGREVEAILNAQNPARAAREIVAQARRDTSGKAVAGLKGAFARHLIGQATAREGVRAVTLRELLRDGRTVGAMSQVFTAGEMSRFRALAAELGKLDNVGRAANVTEVSGVAPPRIIAFIARTMAARQGAKAGQGVSGASLLTANFASRRMQEILEGLTNDRATKIIIDAMENPRLFKALLADPRSVSQAKRAVRSLAPYVTGGTAASVTDD